MHPCPAELLGGHHLVGHGLHHVRPGDEHVGSIADHEDEVGHGRRINVAARAWAHDDADLRDDARSHHVLQEDIGVTREGLYTFLDAGAAGVEQADHRRADLHGLLLHFYDLGGVGAGERAAKHGEVLGEHIDHAAADRAPTGNHAVAWDALFVHSEFVAAMLDEHVELFERALIEQERDPFPR